MIITGLILYSIILAYCLYQHGYKKGMDDAVKIYQEVEQKKVDDITGQMYKESL